MTRASKGGAVVVEEPTPKRALKRFKPNVEQISTSNMKTPSRQVLPEVCADAEATVRRMDAFEKFMESQKKINEELKVMREEWMQFKSALVS